MAGGWKGRAVCAVLALAFVVLAGISDEVLAQGATDTPIPSSARASYSPITEGFESPISPREGLREPRRYVDPREQRLEALRRERMPNAPAFFRDTDLRANSRTYWFDEDEFGLEEANAFTTGGSLTYESGYIADFFQLRGALYTSQPLYANAFAGDSENLTEDGEQITILGQANARMKLVGQEVTAGRQLVRTPFVNPYDVRMIPLTFEGVVLLPEPEKKQKFEYVASYLSRYKPRGDNQFISFSEGLDIDANDGMVIGGASYHANGWNIGVSNYWINDALNTAYGEIDYLFPGASDDGLSFRVGVNNLDQRTVGASLMAGAPYNTYQVSARAIASYRGFVFTGAVSEVGDEADIQKPFGFSTSYTAMIVTSFHDAGVRAYLLRLSYDLERLGLAGVKVEAAWGQGFAAVSAANEGFADQQELDLRITYEPHGGRLEGLRVEVEYIDWQVPELGAPSNDLTQFRTIVNYAIPLL
jgi:outer membrane OprD family porin